MCNAIDVENMIILHLSALTPPTDEETDCEEVDPASLQWISQDYGPIDSERDDLNL